MQAVSFHCWPDAPDHRAYLRNRHRHLFHVEASCDVAHDDREVEFHDVLDQVRAYWQAMAGEEDDMGSASCEALARCIGEHLMVWRPRAWVVEVSEDGEAGARVLTGPL